MAASLHGTNSYAHPSLTANSILAAILSLLWAGEHTGFPARFLYLFVRPYPAICPDGAGLSCLFEGAPNIPTCVVQTHKQA